MVDLRAVGVGAVLAALLVDDGGYYARSWGWSGAVAAAAAALALAWLRRAPRALPERLLAGGLAGLALWALLSAWWSQSPPSSVAEAQRGLVPLAAALAALVLFRRRESGLLAAAVLGAVTLVSAANLVQRATSDSDVSGAAAEPIGYDNALGLLATVGILLALDAATRRGPWTVALVTLAPNALVLLLSESTGALLALAAGLALAAIVAGGRLRPAGAAAIVALVVAGAVAAGGHERDRYWPVALDAAREHPLAGAGAGTFWQLWLEERDVVLDARDAHGLYVETLGELGAVGLALVLVALAAPAVAALRGPRRPLLAAGVTFAGASMLDRATAAERDGRPVDAIRSAERAASLQPWASEPWLVAARARRATGRGDADVAAREGLERDANDWRLWLALAETAMGAERERALARARSLNPLGGF